MKWILLLAIFSCVSNNGQTPVKPQLPTSEVVSPEPVKEEVQPTAWETPRLNLPSSPSIAMKNAEAFFYQYGNSDEFYTYLRSVAKPLQGGNKSNLEDAIKQMRECLNTRKPINIVWKNYSLLYRKTVLGGWNGVNIVQNPYPTMDQYDRAAHWFHEVTHVCGLSHNSNNISKNPIIKKSFPYQAGYAFEAFLKLKASAKLADK